MILDIDFLIDFFKKNTDIKTSDLDEQEGAGGESTAPAGASPKKWETGLARGKANQVANTKWESGRTFGKTYMNDPKYKWISGRAMGKTGGSDFA